MVCAALLCFEICCIILRNSFYGSCGDDIPYSDECHLEFYGNEFRFQSLAKYSQNVAKEDLPVCMRHTSKHALHFKLMLFLFLAMFALCPSREQSILGNRVQIRSSNAQWLLLSSYRTEVDAFSQALIQKSFLNTNISIGHCSINDFKWVVLFQDESEMLDPCEYK